MIRIHEHLKIESRIALLTICFNMPNISHGWDCQLSGCDPSLYIKGSNHWRFWKVSEPSDRIVRNFKSNLNKCSLVQNPVLMILDLFLGRIKEYSQLSYLCPKDEKMLKLCQFWKTFYQSKYHWHQYGSHCASVNICYLWSYLWKSWSNLLQNISSFGFKNIVNKYW